MINDNIEKRILPGEIIPESVNVGSIIGICKYLFLDLLTLLDKEGRFFGITKSYLNSIWLAYDRIGSGDDNITMNAIYLYKPTMIRTFTKLRRKHISEADCVITILHRILEIISGNTEYQYNKELRTLKKIITKLFDNIRNKHKNDSLYTLSETITTCLEKGLTGKYLLRSFSIIPVPKEVEILDNEGPRMNNDSEQVVVEVEL